MNPAKIAENIGDKNHDNTIPDTIVYVTQHFVLQILFYRLFCMMFI